MDKAATEMYQALYEILDSTRKIKMYNGTPLNLGEKQIVENNFRFIEQRGKEAMKVYESARRQEDAVESTR